MERKIRKQFLTKKEKEVKKLFKRLNVLYKARRDLGFIELDPPIRSGWERLFVLRSDLKTHKDYNILKSILPKIQNVVVSDNKEFVTTKKKRKKARPIEQDLNSLTEDQYNDLEDREKDYFFPTWKMSKYWKVPYRVWVFTNPRFFEYKIQPHFITKAKLMDPEIEREINLINDKLFGVENLYARYGADKSSSYKSYGKEARDSNLERQILKEIEEELYDHKSN